MAQTPHSSGDVGRLINLVPVGLKEAAIDSPTARATIVHYGDQVDLVEKWLDEYMRATNRLITESLTLENILNNFTSHASLPIAISEAMLDHDYSVLAMKKYADGAKDFWTSMVSVVRRLSTLVVDPIRQFIQNDLRAFKEARRQVEATQKHFDHLQIKYAGLGKSKEASSLREDAFQLHEARKAYLRASMDFAALAPQMRFSLDRLLVKIFFDQWKEMRISRDNTAAVFQRTAGEMERVKGWISEMETSEKSFKRELQTARKQLEDAAEASFRPSRELDDYNMSTVPQYGGHAHGASGPLQRSPKKGVVPSAEKQGWLFLRTYTGKPTRTAWIKRWAFLRNGVFGWLVQGARNGGVEETERIGVLLCNVRPAPGEERRFCLELKTNRNSIVLQAETQSELVDWISALETAKSKALEDPGASDTLATAGQRHSDPAFAISAPPVPEFGSLILSSTEPGASADDNAAALDRANTLPVSGNDSARDSSVDLPRRGTAVEESSSHRDHAARIISKLDLHRKSNAQAQPSPSPSTPNVGGGIASLIAASHGSMPVGPTFPMIHNPQPEKPRNIFTLALRDMPPSSLAPSTLANVPAPTNLSKSAVLVTGERGLSSAINKSGIPNSLLANMWGSSNSGYVNRLERSDLKVTPDARLGTQTSPSPLFLPSASPPTASSPPVVGAGASNSAAVSQLDLGPPQSALRSRSTSPGKRHRNTINLDEDAARQIRTDLTIADFPNYYPLQLKTQDAQFRLLFPTVRRDDRLVMVFRATWNPNDQQDFPGRVYMTPRDIYFYSNHLGMVLTSTVSLASIDEATAAPGRECDFLFLHLKEGGIDGSPTRITIKTFLEPLKLLQRRINFLVRNSVTEERLALEDVVKKLLKMESEAPERSPSLESWEDVSPDTPVDGAGPKSRARGSTIESEFRSPVRVDRALYRSATAQIEPTKFKLPAQPVNYTPAGNLRLAAEREFDVSPKALFHVMFGDKSALWQLLQHERRARNLKQGPWINLGEGRLRRDFEFEIPSKNMIGRETIAQVRDYQVVDVNSDHLCYVVTDKRTPWYLPYQASHRLVSKIVITHVAKGKCKLAVFIRVEWLRDAWLLQGIIERQGLHDLDLDSQDLADLVADQVRKLGAHSRTKKAIQIFGQVGHSSDITQLHIDAAAHSIETRRAPIPRTMTDLLLQSGATATQSAFGITLAAVIDMAKWLHNALSTHKLLLFALLVSALYNTYHTTTAVSSSYHERQASKFMSRLGIAPDAVMSKSVYVSDLDDVLTSLGALPNREASSCYAVFADEYRLDASASTAGSAIVQRTRQRLGAHRHDLLVAMRVVNSVEREMLVAEWESWVVQEGRRCRAVEGVIEGSNSSAAGGVSRWYGDYCASCCEEMGKLGVL